MTKRQSGQQFKAEIKIGILGGGQLARMLAMSAQPLGLSVSVLAVNQHEPAAQVVGATTFGSVDDEKALRAFLAPLNFVTFESEFIDTDLLQRCLPKTCHAFPPLPAMALIQDRLTQKQLLDRFKIPTSPWMSVNSKADLQSALQKFPAGFVLKQRRFGYDGYGTFMVRSERDIDESWLEKTKFGFIAEARVDFKRELAFSLVRSAAPDSSTAAKFVALPLVESVQKNARCFSVQGPVRNARLAHLQKAARRLMQELNYEGILAFELFETKQGLLVNELAPRVHNSAHYSIDALSCSQFEYHCRAGLGMALPAVELLRQGFAMLNLLGDGGASVQLSSSPQGHLHWYGKTENRAGRKLGHINALDSNSARALKKLLQWRKDFKL